MLAARLADARFFWEQDLKVPLEEQAKKLDGIVFHEKLGTVADKVERVAKLAEWLATEKIVPKCDPKQARRAAELAKADLVTGMVGEFPELQGVIGGYLAEAQGEPKAVADAIRDHYKPVGQGDDVPTAPVTVAVSLADKLDSLICFFAIDEQPTGSKDPFALRRSGARRDCPDDHQWIEIRPRRSDRGMDRHVRPCSQRAWRSQPATPGLFRRPPEGPAARGGVRHDLIDAVFALGGEDDLVRLLARVKALQGFVETGEGTNLLAAYKRAANILKKEEWQLGPGSSPR